VVAESVALGLLKHALPRNNGWATAFVAACFSKHGYKQKSVINVIHDTLVDICTQRIKKENISSANLFTVCVDYRADSTRVGVWLAEYSSPDPHL
jgi:hypothetical protein